MIICNWKPFITYLKSIEKGIDYYHLTSLWKTRNDVLWHIFLYIVVKVFRYERNDVLSTILTSYLKTEYILESGANNESFFHLQIQQPAAQIPTNTKNIIPKYSFHALANQEPKSKTYSHSPSLKWYPYSQAQRPFKSFFHAHSPCKFE